MSSGVPTPTLLTYSDIVDVNMANNNDINFADIEDYGHRVSIQMEKTKLNEIFRWSRSVGDSQPSAQIGVTTGFRAALIDALGTTYTDIDGVTGGLHFGSANLSLNTDARIRKDDTISANDIPMAFVLYKLYGNSTVSTLGNIFNLQDAHDMLTNATVADAIIASLEVNESGAVNTMFKDLLAADPRRFFGTNGVPVTGIFETNTDISGSGSWNFTDDDIIEIKTKLVFNSRVTRRGAAGSETNITASDGSSVQNNQQTIISPDDYFYIRLQLKAAEVGIATSIANVISATTTTAFINSLTTLSANLTSANRATAKAELKASIATIKSNLGGVQYVSVPGSAIQGFVTESVTGYNIAAKDKIFLLYANNDLISLSAVENDLATGTKEIYLFGLPGETVRITIGTVSAVPATHALTTTSTGITYNGVAYPLGSSIVLGAFTLSLNFLGSGGGTLRGFKPQFVSNMVTWLDANDSTSITLGSGANIAQWRDKSGLNNHFTPTAGTPQRAKDGAKWVVSFPLNSTMSATSNITATPNTTNLFMIIKLEGTNYIQRFQNFQVSGVNTLYVDRILAGGPGMSAGGNDFSNNYRVNGSRNAVTTATYTNYHILDAPFGLGSAITDKFEIGRSTEGFLGKVCEVIIYNNAIDLATREKIEGYLAWKWGMTATLSSDHPWKTTPPY
jgi:hypothetical protein